MTSTKTRLKSMLGNSETLVVPGAANALTARIIEDIGFPAVYLSGAAVANSFLGVPDIGLTSLSEVAAHVGAVRGAITLPLIVDADTGFGNALNTWHAVRVLERAGADAIQLEDQTFPKRCGHFAGKSVISSAEMIDKIAIAREARSDPDTLIIARTDARAEHGLAEACSRANAYREAGADMLFVEAPESIEEIETIISEVPGLHVHNYVEGGVTPPLPPERLSELGYSIALYANLALLASISATRDVLGHLLLGGNGERPKISTWNERQDTVRKPWFDELADKYGSSEYRNRLD
jgi:2-methylisocitrate lyase-like PEP mutase family enzyme